MNIVALDIGDKRVGVALSRGNLASPAGWFDRKNGKAEKQLIAMIGRENIEQVLVGVPLNADHTLSLQARKCIRFARRLQRRVSAAFLFVDEYASTYEAASLEGLTPKGEKGVLDARSASILLQSFLEGRAVLLADQVLAQEPVDPV